MSETLRDLVVLLSLQKDNFTRSRTKRNLAGGISTRCGRRRSHEAYSDRNNALRLSCRWCKTRTTSTSSSMQR